MFDFKKKDELSRWLFLRASFYPGRNGFGVLVRCGGLITHTTILKVHPSFTFLWAIILHNITPSLCWVLAGIATSAIFSTDVLPLGACQLRCWGQMGFLLLHLLVSFFGHSLLLELAFYVLPLSINFLLLRYWLIWKKLLAIILR